MWPPGVPQPDDARVDEDGLDKRPRNKSSLDTECTKTLVCPQCVTKEDYLGWDIPYHTASSKLIYFPAASVELEIKGRVTNIPVGVSEHTGQDMLMGRDIPHFRNFLNKELKEETREEGEEPTTPASAETEVGMVVTQARQRQQDALEEEHLRQEQDRPVITTLDSVNSGVQAEGTEDHKTEEGQAEMPGENQVDG